MAGVRKSSRVSFVKTCCGSSDRWNRYAGLRKRVARGLSKCVGVAVGVADR